jgi:hypothetical protein
MDTGTAMLSATTAVTTAWSRARGDRELRTLGPTPRPAVIAESMAVTVARTVVDGKEVER